MSLWTRSGGELYRVYDEDEFLAAPAEEPSRLQAEREPGRLPRALCACALAALAAIVALLSALALVSPGRGTRRRLVATAASSARGPAHVTATGARTSLGRGRGKGARRESRPGRPARRPRREPGVSAAEVPAPVVVASVPRVPSPPPATPEFGFER